MRSRLPDSPAPCEISSRTAWPPRRHGSFCEAGRSLAARSARLVAGFDRDELGGKARQGGQAAALPQDARVRQEANPVLARSQVRHFADPTDEALEARAVHE